MSEEKEKTSLESLDVSAYMPSAPCGPPDYTDKVKYDSLANKLQCLIGQQVTVYVMSMTPSIAGVPVGQAVVPSGLFYVTGILHAVGADFLEVHTMTESIRVVYIPITAVAMIVPGGPLVMVSETGTVVTNPTTI